MIRKLLATTALATLVSTAAFAQEATTPAPATPAPAADTATPVGMASGYLGSNLMGEEVYNGTADDAEKIGDVSDVVISDSGQIESVIVGVGGFLGIGQKDVAVNFGDLKWTDRNGDRWLVADGVTKESLEAQTAFDKTPYEPAPAPVANDASGTMGTGAAGAGGTAMDTAQAPAASDTTAPADQTAQTTAPAAGAAPTDQTAQNNAATDTTQTAAIDKSQLTAMPEGEMRAEDLVGTTVYGANDANIGEIGDVLLTTDGKIDAYLIDVGGFLGMGEKQVAVGSDKLSFMADKDGNKYLYTTFTKEQLDAAQAYDEGTYANNRDQQRVIMQ